LLCRIVVRHHVSIHGVQNLSRMARSIVMSTRRYMVMTERVVVNVVTPLNGGDERPVICVDIRCAVHVYNAEFTPKLRLLTTLFLIEVMKFSSGMKTTGSHCVSLVMIKKQEPTTAYQPMIIGFDPWGGGYRISVTPIREDRRPLLRGFSQN